MQIGQVMIYLDEQGQECGATVISVSPLHPEFPTLGYFDRSGHPHKAFDVPHMSHQSRQETNPDLPTYHINCWKNFGETHTYRLERKEH